MTPTALVTRLCSEASVPVTAAGGRSGVVGGSIPLFGGVLLDLCALTGIRSVDSIANVVDVGAGTFGDIFEDELQSSYGLTVGHWPQSIALSTIGGWLACRGAGQLSNRYGKIEDIVVGLDVVLADGTMLSTGGHARQAAGPDLNQLFVGSEGTLGIITGARLPDIRFAGLRLALLGCFIPIIHGALGVAAGLLAGLSPGGSAVLGAMAGSASYIAAPAAVRVALPDANPGYYLTLALGITFPFNLAFGIPLYIKFAEWFSIYL